MLPRATLIGVVAMFAVSAVLPLASTYASRALVARIEHEGHGVPVGLWWVVVLVAVLTGLLLCQQLVLIAFEPLQSHAAREIDRKFRRGIGELAVAPVGIGHLEDSEIAGRLSVARTAIYGFTVGQAALAQVSLVVDLLAGFSCAVVLLTLSPWLSTLMVALLVLRRFARLRLLLGFNWLVLKSASLSPKVHYWFRAARSVPEAKEIRVFGLQQWIGDNWRALAEERNAPVRAARGRVLLRMWFPLVTGIAAVFLGLLGIRSWAESSAANPGDLTQGITALMATLTIGGAPWPAFQLAHGRPVLEAAEQLRRQLVSPPRVGATPLVGADPHVPPLVRFEDVGFSYPGRAEPVLDGFSLELAPGEVVALVGVNGAGKTTTSKLLARLYEPVRGRITADGHDLADLPEAEWRRNLAIVTQGFIRYDLTVRQNVTMGAPERLGDDAFFAGVVDELDLADIVDKLPLGWDTPLSRERSGGTDLSGGQWQRIALARAILALRAGRRILVLDEPTAHLDAEAEFDTFKKVIAAARGATVILISHRLSTVRLADRIAVLRDGRVGESGSHEELIARRTEYAEMFDMQARQFLNAAPAGEEQ